MNEFLQAVGFRNLTAQQSAALEEMALETIMNNCLATLSAQLDPKQVDIIETLLEHEDYQALDVHLREWLDTDLATLINDEVKIYQAEAVKAAKIARGEDV